MNDLPTKFTDRKPTGIRDSNGDMINKGDIIEMKEEKNGGRTIRNIEIIEKETGIDKATGEPTFTHHRIKSK